MARRRTHQLQSLYRQRTSRPISPSDGPGWIYVYIDNGNEFKIGMTKNFERRFGLNQYWLRIDVERNLLSTFFWRFSCRVHVEKFVFAGNRRDIRRKILGPALRWAVMI
ncbi:hypothetical protein F5879DRAFT_927790 [Lentinula edodes]|uniref:uncharacterized protein n=1 Tax=Lentinula edodes TaxID=5353 RepID=UPI001E8DF468|nr:uncharacterized protein C8R40DRAFT_1065190 [Lentinula edodes]KAH7881537.1 hypothetical protein C8R40DRAFT_1065190 [Lentinula edodes]KAJ3897500.1 hypothetical protein F5879DRAFT_927790 [Lentinula edodes]KAJ3916894.1 hypothetical protein F5877DRAFT_68689 [Lentinula edodes]